MPGTTGDEKGYLDQKIIGSIPDATPIFLNAFIL